MIAFPLLYIIRCNSSAIMCQDMISNLITHYFKQKTHAFRLILHCFMVSKDTTCQKSNISKLTYTFICNKVEIKPAFGWGRLIPKQTAAVSWFQKIRHVKRR